MSLVGLLLVRIRSTYIALYILGLSIYFYIATIAASPSVIFKPAQLQKEHFRRLIAAVGPAGAQDPVHIAALQERLLPHMRGVVLDIGPGDGAPMHSFAPFARNVDVVYGAEPNERLHSPLLAAASKAGFNSSKEKSGKYIPLTTGIEPQTLFPALASAGLIESGDSKGDSFKIPAQGVFDTIVSIRALCSCDGAKANMPAMLAILNKLLKPGGELLMIEHVANDEDAIASGTQRLLNVVWPTLVGGCTLRGTLVREMRRLAREGKQWRNVDVRGLAPFGQDVMIVPFVVVRAVKAG